MSAPVRDEPPAAEELVLGPRPSRRLPPWFPLLALCLGVLIVAGGAAWRFWPRPVAPLTLAELENTYAGMVRSDGTNDASVMTRQTVAETPLTVTPAACAPLIEATVANRFPDAALDGVGTYWLGQGSTISLFTLRFPDAAAAEAERTRVADALDGCADATVFVRRTQQAGGAWQASVGRSVAGSGSDDQLGYVLRTQGGVMAIQLLPYVNTLTWQYRYETGATAYSPLAADQLMQGLHAQLDSVVAARPR